MLKTKAAMSMHLRGLIGLLLVFPFSINANENCSTLVGGQALSHVHNQIDTLNNTVSKIGGKEEISCSPELGSDILKAIQNEISSSSKSLSMSFYHNLDKVMYCDSKGEIKKETKQKLLEQLEELKKLKKTPFVWADAKGVRIWEEELPEIRQALPFRLSQLNSSVIAFVPSEKDNQTTYNLEADLRLPIFSSWDRRKDLINYEEAEKEKENRILQEPSTNFTRNYGHIEVSKIGIKKEATCYYYVEKEKIQCDQDFTGSITHEITHLLETRFPHFFKTLLKAEGGQKDRLKKAQEIIPQFGITKCTPSVYEDYCSDGPISQEDASKIAKATKIIQEEGNSAKRFYAKKLSSEDSFCQTPVVKQNNQNYCVYKEDSLYSFVRNGDEYLQVLVDKAFNDKEQFESSASSEEKHLIGLLKEYLY